MLCNRSVTGYDRSTCDFYHYGINKLCKVLCVWWHRRALWWSTVGCHEKTPASANALTPPRPGRHQPTVKISYYPRYWRHPGLVDMTPNNKLWHCSGKRSRNTIFYYTTQQCWIIQGSLIHYNALKSWKLHNHWIMYF